MILSFHESPDKSQISYFLLCNYIDLFIPVAIPGSDRLFNHAQSLQLAGDKVLFNLGKLEISFGYFPLNTLIQSPSNAA